MNKFSPKHYQRGKIQVWDFIADQNLDFFLGNVVKYVCRAGHKDQEGELCLLYTSPSPRDRG